MNYIDVNREGWNKRTALHVDSDFYKHKEFLAGKTSLKEIELGLLGDIKGKKILHLQCHFGQDSISLARMGAIVTAVDLAPDAIEFGNKTAIDLGVEVEFICSDVLAPDLLAGREFDMIFTSYGAIPWLPDLKPWAKLISDKLVAGGKLLFIEFHPILHMYDDDMVKMEYSYFNTDPIKGGMSGSYAEEGSEEIPYVVWNHSLSEVMTVLINKGLSIRQFDEYNFSPYPCFAGMIPNGESRYIIEKFGDKMPMVFSIVAEK